METATSTHIDNSGRDQHVDWEQGYGYQFWRCRNGRYRGDGMCGQYCLVSDSEDAVMAMTAGTNDMWGQMDAVHDLLLGAIDAEPGTAEDQEALKQRIATLGYSYPTNDGTGRDVSGTYRAESGREITLKCEPHKIAMTLKLEKDTYGPLIYPLDGTALLSSVAVGVPGELASENVLCGGGWHDGKLTMVLRLTDGPFYRIDRMKFSDDALIDDSIGAMFGDGKVVEYKRVKV